MFEFNFKLNLEEKKKPHYKIEISTIWLYLLNKILLFLIIPIIIG